MPSALATLLAATQNQADNSTKVATTAYVDLGLSGKANTSHQHNKADFTDEQLAAATADQSLANTTPTNITNLGVAIGASATEMWFAEYWLMYQGANTTMDLRIGFATLPAGAALRWGPLNASLSSGPGWQQVGVGATPGTMLTGGSSLTAGTSGGNDAAIALGVLILGGGTAGNVNIQYSQSVSDAGTLKILRGSFVRADRLST